MSTNLTTHTYLGGGRDFQLRGNPPQRTQNTDCMGGASVNLTDNDNMMPPAQES